MKLTTQVRDLPWTGAGPAARVVYEQAKKAGHERHGDWFKLGLVLYDGGQHTEALDAFQTAAKLAESKAPALVWQGHMLDLLGRREDALRAYREALAQWPAGLVQRHDQWKLEIDRAWVEERLQKPFAGRF